MKRRIVSLLMVIAMTAAIAGIAAADTGIADSMEFKGEGLELSLSKALEIVMKDNPTIMKSELDLAQAQEDYDKGKRTLSKVRQMVNIRDTESLSYLESYALLELSNNFTLENAKREYDATAEGVKAGLEESYYGLLQAEQLVQIMKENMEVSKDLHEKTKQKLELGLVAKQEVLKSELSFIEAQNSYDSAVNTYKSAKMFLNTKLGNDVMTELVLKDDLAYKQYEPVVIGEAVQSALENRYEVKALAFAAQIADINKRIAEKKYPDVTYQYKEANINYQKAMKDLENGKKNIEMEVRSNYMNMLQKQQEIESGKKAVQLAEEALNIARVSYDAGLGVMTDVQQAQVAVQQAKLGLSKAILDYNLAVLTFEDSIGVGRIQAAVPGAGA
jgi:outer membrane protein TolC